MKMAQRYVLFHGCARQHYICLIMSEKFVLAESQAIYRYLARKIGILGNTEHEMALVEQFCYSWEELHEKFWPLFGRWKKLLTPEQFDETMKDILHNEIKPVVVKHEEALAKNGTGFYVGDKVSSYWKAIPPLFPIYLSMKSPLYR